jgi:hypothetical protein
MTPVTLEVTFHFDKAKPGAHVRPTEELVARLSSSAEERRRPNPRDRAQVYQQVLDRTKARLGRLEFATSYTDGRRIVYRWTLTGTNTGPAGTGKAVRSSGLIAASKGHFDEVEYHRQLKAGVE